MIVYVVRRIASLAIVMTLVGVFVFLLLHLAPGDPAALILGENASPAQIVEMRAKLGLDDPLLIQFMRWSLAVLTGDLGISIFSNMPVIALIEQRMEATLSLAFATLLFSVPVALALGVLAAWKAGTTIDRGTMVVSVAGFSVPTFVVGYLMIYTFAITLNWLPVQGYTSLTEDFGDWARHLVLPAFTLGLLLVAFIARITRATMLDVLAEDYIRTAKAKGVSTEAILMKHALRNAGVPVITVIGIGVTMLLGGVVITETVFSIPGVGRLVVEAVLKRDYPVIQGVMLLFSGLFMIINLLVDLSYTLIDPRIRY